MKIQHRGEVMEWLLSRERNFGVRVCGREFRFMNSVERCCVGDGNGEVDAVMFGFVALVAVCC